MHLAPVTGQHTLKNKNAAVKLGNQLPHLKHMVLDLRKQGRLPLQCLALMVIGNAQDDFFVHRHEKGQHAPHILHGGIIQVPVPVAADVKHYKRQTVIRTDAFLKHL